MTPIPPYPPSTRVEVRTESMAVWAPGTVRGVHHGYLVVDLDVEPGQMEARLYVEDAATVREERR